MLARARHDLAAIPLPPGCHLSFAGEDKELRKNREEMGLVMIVSLALITLAMVIQFNSVMKSVVVMLTVPLGMIGAFAGLAGHEFPARLHGPARQSSAWPGSWSATSLCSAISLRKPAPGACRLKEALVHAGLARLRPVLVTVFATVGGLIPLFLTGGALWHPLTAVHIFGLLSGHGLTLIVLPVLYYVFCARLKLIK